MTRRSPTFGFPTALTAILLVVGSGSGCGGSGSASVPGGGSGGALPGSSGGASGTQSGGRSGGGGSSTGGSSPATGGSGLVGSGGNPTTGSGGKAGGAGGTTTATGGTIGPAGGASGACPSDPNLPPEPMDPPVCTTLTATKSTPDEGALDTARIQAALNGCGAGKAVKLTSAGANSAFVTGKLTINGTTLWVDAGTTLYASRNPASYGCTASTSATANSCGAVITVTGANAGIVGSGTIDGQGGEPIVGQTQSWWDISVALRASNGSASNPALITVSNATNVLLHNIHIFNSPKFHVKLSSAGFMVWGVEVMTPSKPMNSAGKPLTPYGARNTDGIDPGAGGGGSTSRGYIVCSKISVGDDEIAIKGGGAPVSNLTIAHNHFGTGHGMSIGSETNAGVSNVSVYDLTIDGSLPTGGAPSSDVNGIRIKSDPSRGGLVDRISYSDVCMRGLANPILLNPTYSTSSGSSIPQFTNIAFRNIQVAGGGIVTLDGFDSAHLSSVSLDNVLVAGNPTVKVSNLRVMLGPGNVSFAIPPGAGVTVIGASGPAAPLDCDSRWVTFP